MTEIKLSYGRVSKSITWRETWIIGNGDSARSADWRVLSSKQLLWVNPKTPMSNPILSGDCLFSLDQNWVRNNRDLLETISCEKYLALPLETWPELGNISEVTYLQWSHADGLSEDPGVICTGCNSGYGALNLAYLKGAQEIHLVGYDMDPTDNDQYQFWAPLFRNTLPQLNARGITVINHNEHSYIDAFPRRK